MIGEAKERSKFGVQRLLLAPFLKLAVERNCFQQVYCLGPSGNVQRLICASAPGFGGSSSIDGIPIRSEFYLEAVLACLKRLIPPDNTGRCRIWFVSWRDSRSCCHGVARKIKLAG